VKIPPSIPVYGDIKFRDPKCRKERPEQKEFFAWLKECRPRIHEIAIHPKNEGKRTAFQQQEDKELGALTTGAPDIMIPGRVPFLCELKRLDLSASKVRSKQVAYLVRAQEYGAFVCFALGSENAIKAFLDWEAKYLLQ
jgi:hypothetical protein